VDLPDSLAAANVYIFAAMTSSVLIAARVSPQTKARLAALANAQQLTESAFLKRLVESAFQVMSPPSSEAIAPMQPRDRSARLYVRLRDDDRLLLRERAAARGMPAATYASLLIRAHLRRLTPLPTQEFKELRSSLLAISAIGRNLNQLARVANETGNVVGVSVNDFHAVLRACEGLRDAFRKLIVANVKSWETGRPESQK
jgi:hypothetical protein